MRLLFEIGMEEIPARFLNQSLQDLKNNMKKKLDENRVKFETINTFGTPRRMVLSIDGICEIQEDLNVENVGPAKSVAFDNNGEISRAGLGFLKSQGATIEQMEIKKTEKGEYIVVKKFVKGKNTFELLPELLKTLVLELSFQKSMKWSNKKIRFARPLQWFLAIADGRIVDFEIEGIRSSNKSRGHRFFGNEFTVDSVDDYFKKIRENNVIIDITERKELIKKLINEKCITAGEKVHIEEELLAEVTNLVEYPYPIVGTFNQEFLEVPQEVLIISMQVHQRYFPILNTEGKLQAKFVVIRNGIEDSEYVRKGNEKVLSARLSDARFFYNEDLKNPLYKNIEKLKSVVYQKDLGTIYEKLERMKEISQIIIRKCDLDSKRDNILRTIELCKADLVSNMIGEKEFTKLQGLMGEEYALKSGENLEVALGIKEHYYPRFQGDMLPSGIEGAVVGIADRLDTLIGCYAVGLIPTSSKDPFALRRAALGVVNIMLNSKLEFSVTEVIQYGLNMLESKEILKISKEKAYKELSELFTQRVTAVFSEMGYRRDIVSAVLDKNNSSLIEVKSKVEALEKFTTDENFNKFIMAAKRIRNISEECKNLRFIEELMTNHAEKQLYNFMSTFEDKVVELLEAKRYDLYIAEILSSVELIDKYFEEVMVNDSDENIRNNRLSQMKLLDDLFNKMANLKLIESN